MSALIQTTRKKEPIGEVVETSGVVEKPPLQTPTLNAREIVIFGAIVSYIGPLHGVYVE